jgi:hypothetical protein
MKRQSKSIIVILGAAALITGATGAAFAYGGYGPGWGGHPGRMGGPGAMMGGYYGYTDQQLATLKQSLAITSAQESAWNDYAQALQAQSDLMQAHRQAMFVNGMPSVDKRLAFHQQGLAQMQRVVDARRALFATLTPQQQAQLVNQTGRGCWNR